MGGDMRRSNLWQQNAYDWFLIDPVLAAAYTNHVGMILTIAWTPQWAADTSRTGFCHQGNGPGGKTAMLCDNPPKSYGGAYTDWANFLNTLMAHLTNLGYPNPVKYIELWNEANTYRSRSALL